MNIRIEQIKVRRNGPLRDDFEFNCADLNLIHGANETGKSYLVECLIKSLFKTTGKKARPWTLRRWNLNAQVSVSGLNETSVVFKPSSKEKLDTLWHAPGQELPENLAHLLVVKQGATWLSPAGDDEDGVGMDVLRNFLSGEKLLEGLEKRIPKNLQSASLNAGQIEGRQAGEIKERAALEKQLVSLNALLDACNIKSSSAGRVELESEKEKLLRQIEILDAAKRHRAFRLDRAIGEQEFAIGDLTSEEESGKLRERISQFRIKKQKLETETTSEKRKRLQHVIDDHQYLKQAVTSYKSLTAARKQGEQSDWSKWLPVGLALMAAAIATGIAGWTIVAILLGAIALVLVGGHIWFLRRHDDHDPQADAEFERLAAEYKRRFNNPLTDLAGLEATREKYSQLAATANATLQQQEQANRDLDSEHDKISLAVSRVSGGAADEPNWDQSIEDIQNARREIKQNAQRLARELQQLGVPKDQYLSDDPKSEYDAAEIDRLQTRLKSIEQESNRVEDELQDIQRQIIVACGIDFVPGWEDLLDALRKTRDDVAEKLRAVTAEIISKIVVYQVVTEQRDRQNDHIRAELQSELLEDILKNTSIHYQHFHLAENEQLEVEDTDGDRYPVSQLSTGAREQIFLSLRIGFATRALRHQPGFLILDDAFQHSDYKHRKVLIEQCMSLIDRGWQIFYFSMDDHIRHLLQAKGKRLGDRFSEKVLERYR